MDDPPPLMDGMSTIALSRIRISFHIANILERAKIIAISKYRHLNLQEVSPFPRGQASKVAATKWKKDD